MDNLPIGIFDSGLGGLTVVKEIKKVLPYENIVYLGDTARVPYGTRSREIIVKFSLQDAEFLTKKKVKCIIVACNTVSANALNELKEKLKIPVFGVIEPGSKEASKITKNKKVGVIGTRGTISSHAYQKEINKINRQIKVFEESTPLFVPFIEEGEIKGQIIDLLTEKYLSFFKNKKIDTLILGCTHYPIIESVIAKELAGVKLVNPGKEIAKELKVFLKLNNMCRDGRMLGDIEYYVTDLTSRFINTASLFLEKSIIEKTSKVTIE